MPYQLIKNTLKKQVKRIPIIAHWFRVIYYFFILYKTNIRPDGVYFSGTPLMEKGLFEPEESKLIKILLKNCNRFINIGANVGYYVCMAAQNKKKVTAFEPLHSNLKIMYKNLLQNNWTKNVEIFPVSLGKNVALNKIYGHGTGASLIGNWNNAGISNFKITPTTTLDYSLKQRFEKERLLILVDIEGFELEMLLGAKNILNVHPKPIWIIEISFSDHMPQNQKYKKAKKVFELMWSSGYRSYFADINLIEFKKETLAMIIKRRRYDSLTSNFVFFEEKLNPEIKKNRLNYIKL
ncbi:FkbM family methyltransferase [Candidatus Methylopumilus universalis]|jgi:FkbM family methyltransferase|uniref:FkbM family methyltransferase n=1 Tax=Candidatus Methylopumilus universalis TaxID=2588536 RepID=UPI003BEF4498